MFTPFAFVKSSSYTLGPIVTSSLAFYINATNGNTTDTIGGQTGSITGSISNNSNQYWSGFTLNDFIYYNANTFNPPTSGSSTFEAWLYYPAYWVSESKIGAPIGIDKSPSYEDDFVYFGYASQSVYTLIGGANVAPSSKPDVEFFTSASVSGMWCHVVTTINGFGLNDITTYVQPLNSTMVSSSNAVKALEPTDYGTYMYVGKCAGGSEGFAAAFENSGSSGLVGLVRIYNKALSIAEIEQKYNAERLRFETY